MKYFLKHITQINLPIAILLSVGCLGFWVPDFVSLANGTFPSGTWGSEIATLLLVLLNAIFLVLLIYQRGITRQLEGLPMLLYLLVCSTIPNMHNQWLGQVIIFILQIILFLVMNSYRNSHATEAAFLSAMLLSIGVLLMPDLVWLFPVLWAMFAIHRAMNLRVFLASLIGVAVVAIYQVVFDWLGWIKMVDWGDIWLRISITQYPLLSCIIMSIVGVFFVFLNLTRQNVENTQITTFVWCLMLIFVPCAVLVFFPLVYFLSPLVVALYCLTALATYYFASSQTVVAGSIFLGFVAVWIGQYFYIYVL